MTPENEFWLEVDEQGRLVLPPEVRERYELQPGAQVRLKMGAKTLRLHRPVTHLDRVYLEPTSRCNLSCRTCIRNAWDEAQGDMPAETFERFLAGLHGLRSKPVVFLGGFGEPLILAHIVEWVKRLKPLARRVELITNGLLL